MTKEQYGKSIDTGELQLVGFWEKLSHFGLVYFLLFIPSVLLFFNLFDYIRGKPSFFRMDELWLVVIPLVLSALVFLLQKKRLKFKAIQTTLTSEQIEAIIHQVAVELEWRGKFITKKIYRAKRILAFGRAVGAKK